MIVGGEEQSQLVGGNVTSVDLRQLDEGAQYEVKVLALVRNREGPPVSVRITTGECCCLWCLFPCISSHIHLCMFLEKLLTLFTYFSILQSEYSHSVQNKDMNTLFLIVFYCGLAKNQIRFKRDVSLWKCIEFTVCCLGEKRVTRVEGLRVLDSTPGGLRITWRAVSGASSYRIYWRSSQGGYKSTHIPTHITDTTKFM